jgi:hypothetical protein
LWQRIKSLYVIFTTTRRIPIMADQAQLDAVIAEITALEQLNATIATETTGSAADAANVATVAAAGTAGVQAAQATADANNANAASKAKASADQLAADQSTAVAALAKIKADVANLT